MGDKGHAGPGATFEVTIQPPHVIKKVRPELCSIEAERTKEARKIADSTGLFIVPEVLEVNEPDGILVLEYLPNLVHPMESIAVGATSHTTIADNIGVAIALLHRGMDMSNARKQGTRAGGDHANESDVVLHGDCHPGHTLWSESEGRAAIIDWSGMYVRGENATVRTFGPGHRDVVYWIVELASWSIYGKNTKTLMGGSEIVKNFLSGYERSSGVRMERDLMCKYFRRNVKTRAARRLRAGSFGLKTPVSALSRYALLMFASYFLFRYR